MESFTFNHLSLRKGRSFLDKYDLFSRYWHDFCKRLSTITQLLSTSHYFASVMDKSDQIDVIGLDFRKAFDNVLHSGLMLKLNELGFPSSLINWIGSSLTPGKQLIDIGSNYSSTLAVNLSVSQ